MLSVLGGTRLGRMDTTALAQQGKLHEPHTSRECESLIRCRDRMRPTTAAVDTDMASYTFTRPPSQDLIIDGTADARSHAHDAEPSSNCTPASELTSDDLQAPISAMQKLSKKDATCQSPQAQANAHPNTEPRFGLRPGRLFGDKAQRQDVVSSGILSPRQARQLFNAFMASASTLLPIFDPILDSFENLRSREPFCFAVILTLASHIEGLLLRKQCLTEIKELIAESLFEYPATLGKVQGMILLVAYAEEAWFAIGYVQQMAFDLQLDKLASDHTRDPKNHIAFSCRGESVWLGLCFIEREIAIGTARSSRMPRVSATDLTRLTSHFEASPPSMRLTALVEAVQMRDDFLALLRSAENLEDVGLDKLHHVQGEFEQWLQRWDKLYADRGYDAYSFQRTSLHGQKRYALIFLGSAAIGKLMGNRNVPEILTTSNGALSKIVDFVMAIALDQLDLILQSDSYQWYLKWATNYTILSLTFTCMFALEISKHRNHPTPTDVFNSVTGISQLLGDYHDPFFHHLIEARLSQHPAAPMISGAKPTNSGGNLRTLGCTPEPGSAIRDYDANPGAYNTPYQPTLVDVGGPLEPVITNDTIQRSDTLSQLLETSNWMTNPSSMLLFDVDSWQQTNDFDANC
ncbi:hypothetical protein F4679DRAFT_599087 [Xylaria curta]|nr:hypothetical protein F4679DRAFT_599087 [Xylaria curta]